MQLDWFGDVVEVPAAHGPHCRSPVALPAALTNVPGSQVVHTAHVAAFDVALKLPLVQLAHARSVVAVPSVATRWPAMHVDHATHAVAAFASSSHVPAAHGALGAAPPGQ
jgi:hypothetical protein